MFELPSRLKSLVASSSSLEAQALGSIRVLNPWLSETKLSFFPDYTDHGESHIASVLATAEAIIRVEAFPVLTSEDAAALVGAILVHDLAMHLSEDGFLALISERDPLLPAFDRCGWTQLWEDFLQEARRFDQRTLTLIFGDSELAPRPSLNVLDWTRRDRMLIGEFVRRHHTRLAHEIAISGMPGFEGRVQALQLDASLSGVAGLVARSHGYSLRTMADSLDASERRLFHSVHAVFLMAVLRIADYLQIQAGRAPEELLLLKRLRSPLSRSEWRKHHAVQEMHFLHDDPEAIFVRAYPTNVADFISLRGLLRSIQRELDESWAVLGEVYGRVQSLAGLGLRIRRVRSSLDDLAACAPKFRFHLNEARFQSHPAILPLLARPLYGNRPEIGIRELIQNAVDAVRERRDYWSDRETSRLAKGQFGVTVSLTLMSERRARVEVVDEGIGMKPATVADYFLTAGASFRSASAWKEQHLDSEGHSRVLRSGRFGIGVLAAFLLGDRLSVRTRHVDEEMGVAFECGLDDDIVQLDKWSGPVGTQVVVEVSDVDTILGLQRHWYATGSQRTNSWDWYCLDDPRVVRAINGKQCPQGRTFPDTSEELPVGWWRIRADGYEDILWSLEEGRNAGSLICNGILVAERYRGGRGAGQTRSIEIRLPTVSVFDGSGRLPLNLVRDGLAERPRFFDDVEVEVCKLSLASVLVNQAEKPSELPDVEEIYPGLRAGREIIWLGASREGWIPFDVPFVGRHCLLMAPERCRLFLQGRRSLEEFGGVVLCLSKEQAGDKAGWFRSLVTSMDRPEGWIAGSRVEGVVAVVGKKWWQSSWGKRSPRWGLFREAEVGEETLVVSTGETTGSIVQGVSDWVNLKASSPFVAEVFISPIQMGPSTSFGLVWHRLLGNCPIPYARERRKGLLEAGRRELEPYLVSLERMTAGAVEP